MNLLKATTRICFFCFNTMWKEPVYSIYSRTSKLFSNFKLCKTNPLITWDFIWELYSWEDWIGNEKIFHKLNFFKRNVKIKMVSMIEEEIKEWTRERDSEIRRPCNWWYRLQYIAAILNGYCKKKKIKKEKHKGNPLSTRNQDWDFCCTKKRAWNSKVS